MAIDKEREFEPKKISVYIPRMQRQEKDNFVLHHIASGCQCDLVAIIEEKESFKIPVIGRTRKLRSDPKPERIGS